MALIDQTICSIFDCLLLVTSQTLEVSDVKMRLPLCFLGTSLPDVRSENLAAGGKDHVSARVMSLKLEATDWVNRAVHSLANDVHIVIEWLIDLVEDTLANLEAINDVVDSVNTIDYQSADIVGLTTGRRVECALVKDDQVALVTFHLVGEDFNDFSLEVHLLVIFEVDVASLWQVNRVVENLLWCLHDLLLPRCDLVVEITRCRNASNLGNSIDRDAPRGHGQNPVIDRQLVLFLLE